MRLLARAHSAPPPPSRSTYFSWNYDFLASSSGPRIVSSSLRLLDRAAGSPDDPANDANGCFATSPGATHVARLILSTWAFETGADGTGLQPLGSGIEQPVGERDAARARARGMFTLGFGSPYFSGRGFYFGGRSGPNTGFGDRGGPNGGFNGAGSGSAALTRVVSAADADGDNVVDICIRADPGGAVPRSLTMTCSTAGGDFVVRDPAGDACRAQTVPLYMPS